MEKIKEVTIQSTELYAANIFSTKDETRYGLTGVNIEYTPGRHHVIVATNGRAIMAVRSDHITPEVAPEKQEENTGSLNLSAKLIALIKRMFGVSRSPLSLTIMHHLDSHTVSVTGGGNKISNKLMYQTSIAMPDKEALILESIFPNWRHVVPKDLTPEPDKEAKTGVTEHAYSAHYVSDICEAHKFLFGHNEPRGIRWIMGDPIAPLVAIPSHGNRYVAVLMPIRTDGIKTKAEEFAWMYPAPKPEPQPAAPVEPQNPQPQTPTTHEAPQAQETTKPEAH